MAERKATVSALARASLAKHAGGTRPVRPEVPAVAKALDVLELLAGAPRGLTVNEMVKALGRSMGELYRIVVYLEQRDYLLRDPDTGRYELTLRLFELAHRHAPTDRLIQRALPVLESLAARTQQSCHLAILHHHSVLVLASVASPRPVFYSVRVGAVFPLAETSSGIVILAHMPQKLRDQALAGLEPDEREDVLARVAEVAARGYEERASRLVHGITDLSAPVFDHGGVVAAVTMGYVGQTRQQVGPSEALRAVIEAASALSAALGGGAGDTRGPAAAPATPD